MNMPDPRERIFDAIERARVAVGNVAPLTETERAQIDDCLSRVAVPGQERKPA